MTDHNHNILWNGSEWVAPITTTNTAQIQTSKPDRYEQAISVLRELRVDGSYLEAAIIDKLLNRIEDKRKPAPQPLNPAMQSLGQAASRPLPLILLSDMDFHDNVIKWRAESMAGLAVQQPASFVFFDPAERPEEHRVIDRSSKRKVVSPFHKPQRKSHGDAP